MGHLAQPWHLPARSGAESIPLPPIAASEDRGSFITDAVLG